MAPAQVAQLWIQSDQSLEVPFALLGAGDARTLTTRANGFARNDRRTLTAAMEVATAINAEPKSTQLAGALAPFGRRRLLLGWHMGGRCGQVAVQTHAE